MTEDQMTNAERAAEFVSGQLSGWGAGVSNSQVRGANWPAEHVVEFYLELHVEATEDRLEYLSAIEEQLDSLKAGIAVIRSKLNPKTPMEKQLAEAVLHERAKSVPAPLAPVDGLEDTEELSR